MRLSRQQSITRAFQFARVRREGASVAGRLIVLSAAALESPEEPSGFGIICTKKVASKAVVRNKLKRRVREILREQGDPAAKGFHVVCILRWRAVNATYEELAKDFSKTLRRLLREMPQSGSSSGKIPPALS